MRPTITVAVFTNQSLLAVASRKRCLLAALHLGVDHPEKNQATRLVGPSLQWTALGAS